MLPPMIIYKGKGICRGWTSTVDDADTLFAHSNKGFITGNLAMDWLHYGQPCNGLATSLRLGLPLAAIPASTPRSFKLLKTPRNRGELRQQTMAAIGALESGDKESCIQLLRRMAHQTDAAWTRADIENEDIKVRYAGKKGPRGGRQKMTQAQVADGGFLMKKEPEFQEKKQKAEENVKAKAAKARTKGKTDSVVGKGKGKAAVVAGESSKSAKQKGKEVLYALLLLRIFAYFNSI